MLRRVGFVTVHVHPDGGAATARAAEAEDDARAVLEGDTNALDGWSDEKKNDNISNIKFIGNRAGKIQMWCSAIW